MVLEQLPLHKYYSKVWYQANADYKLLIQNIFPGQIITVAPFIAIGCLSDGIAIYFMIDDLREVCIRRWPKQESVHVSMIYGYNGGFNRMARSDNFITPEVGKQIHNCFVNLQKVLDKCREQSLA